MGAADKDLELKMWFFPYLTWLAIVSIAALLVGMVILESTRESLLLSVALAAVVVGIGVWRYRKSGTRPGSGELHHGESPEVVVKAGTAS